MVNQSIWMIDFPADFLIFSETFLSHKVIIKTLAKLSLLSSKSGNVEKLPLLLCFDPCYELTVTQTSCGVFLAFYRCSGFKLLVNYWVQT